MNPLSFMDIILLALAAPIMLLIGVPAGGYGVAAGVWVTLRAIGVGVERLAAAAREPGHEISLRLGYLLGRLFVLAIVVILVRKDGGRDAGLTALSVIVFAFTVEMVTSVATRPRSR